MSVTPRVLAEIAPAAVMLALRSRGSNGPLEIAPTVTRRSEVEKKTGSVAITVWSNNRKSGEAEPPWGSFGVAIVANGYDLVRRPRWGFQALPYEDTRRNLEVVGKTLRSRINNRSYARRSSGR